LFFELLTNRSKQGGFYGILKTLRINEILMSFEMEQPLEVRLKKRLGEVLSDIQNNAEHLLQQGLPEAAAAGYISTIEYINDLMGSVGMGESKVDQQKFIAEIQDAVRTLVHGLTMGKGEERLQERINIANGNGKLRKEIDRALRNANGTGMSGGYETTMVSESKL